MENNYLYYLYVWDFQYRYFHYMKLYHSASSCHAFIKRQTDLWASAERYITAYKIVRVLPFNDPDSNTSDCVVTQYIYNAREKLRDRIYPGFEDKE